MNFDYRCQNMETMPAGDMNNMESAGMQMGAGCCPSMPVYECPEERVCHRYICYDVPHIKPCNTRIINHHVYRHTFTPCYTSCEENVVENVFDQRCC
ncbi:MAG: hypothetical protein IJO63_03330 [Bacilli bacterium]|nr:hypothetical protein [Bacilli bacterium]